MDQPKPVDTNLYYLLGEINSKIDSLLTRTAEDREHVAKLEGRIAALEKWKWLMVGSASGLGGIAGYFSKVLT